MKKHCRLLQSIGGAFWANIEIYQVYKNLEKH